LTGTLTARLQHRGSQQRAERVEEATAMITGIIGGTGGRVKGG
jgi:hypothetical protein